VLVERARDDLHEISIRRLRWVPSAGEWRVNMESDQPDYQETIKLGREVSQGAVKIGENRVRIVGLVIWKAQPIE